MSQWSTIRRTVVLLAMVTAVALSTTACGSSATPSPTIQPSVATGLDGTWKLTSFVGPDGAPIDVPAAVSPTLVLSGSTVAGNGGCNQFNGQVTITGSTIKYGAISSTQKACEAPTSTVETAFFTALSAVTTFSVAGSTLILSGPDGKPSLTFTKST